MNINLMRKIDKTLGVPMCACLSIWHRCWSWIPFSKPASPPRRILFIEMSEMGSMVLAYSMMMKAKSLFPHSKHYFLTFKNHRCAVDILNVIPENQVVTIDPSTPLKFLLTTIGGLLALRRLHVDAAVDMELFSRFSAMLSYLSGARLRTGYFQYQQKGLYRGRFLTHPVQFNSHLHISRNLLALIKALAADPQEKPMLKTPVSDTEIQRPRFHASRKEKDALQKKIKQDYTRLNGSETLVLLNPNAGDMVPLRRWPLPHYVQLARHILDHPETLILVTGTAGERPEAELLVGKINSPRCLNFAGRTDFRELMVLYDISDILVTNDSGPAHFSTMTGIRSLVLFGPETPELYGPLSPRSRTFYSGYACSPCVSAFNHRLTPCRNNRCLQAVSADQVYREMRKWLPEKKISSRESRHG
ncbi:MAG: glycosyltransferase family 9 protein [Candidatus Aminicenantes bacterium]